MTSQEARHRLRLRRGPLMSRVLVILAAIALVGCILSGIHRCRRRPDLAAHYYDDEYDRFAIANAHCVESLDPYRCRGVL